MPQDEGNGIHIKKDFLLGRGELEVAASGRCSFGHLVREGMQEQERIRERSYGFVFMPNIWMILITQNVSAARHKEKTTNYFQDIGIYCHLIYFMWILLHS